ncbi:MAG: hypothetical protein WCG92_08420, partial [Hyphomicrobiales bacterium]
DVLAAIDRCKSEIMGEKSRQDAVRALGLDPSYRPSAEMPAYVKTELDRWGMFVREAGIEPN